MAKKNKHKKWKNMDRGDLEQMIAQGMAQGGAQGTTAAQNQSFLAGLGQLLPSGRTEQFLLGLLVGGAVTYVLADEELRAKLFKAGIKAYSGLMGGVAEMKEQIADLQAEVQAEQNGVL